MQPNQPAGAPRNRSEEYKTRAEQTITTAPLILVVAKENNKTKRAQKRHRTRKPSSRKIAAAHTRREAIPEPRASSGGGRVPSASDTHAQRGSAHPRTRRGIRA